MRKYIYLSYKVVLFVPVQLNVLCCTAFFILGSAYLRAFFFIFCILKRKNRQYNKVHKNGLYVRNVF